MGTSHKQSPDKPPKVGPYGRREWLPGEGRWRVYLTTCGQDLVTAYLARGPVPLATLRRTAPALFFSLRAGGVFADPDHILHSVAVQAVCRAAVRFDLSAGASFGTYAAPAVRYAVCRHLKPGRANPLPAPVRLPPPNCLPAKPGCEVTAVDARHDAAAALATLRPQHRAALELRGGMGLSAGECGSRLGVSRQRFDQIYAVALAAAQEVAVRKAVAS